MEWPWVSRRKLDIVRQNAVEYHARWMEAETRLQAYQKALDMEEARRRDEQWRRIKAEGRLAYAYERWAVIRQGLWPNGLG